MLKIMWPLYLLILVATILPLLRKDTAKRVALAVGLYLIALWIPVVQEVKIAIVTIAFAVWFWAVFGYIYLSSRKLPLRKYL